MVDLEREWSKLMSDVRERISNKLVEGQLNDWEAAELLRKVDLAMTVDGEGRYPTCPRGHTDDCGWSPSMGYHCI